MVSSKYFSSHNCPDELHCPTLLSGGGGSRTIHNNIINTVHNSIMNIMFPLVNLFCHMSLIVTHTRLYQSIFMHLLDLVTHNRCFIWNFSKALLKVPSIKSIPSRSYTRLSCFNVKTNCFI